MSERGVLVPLLPGFEEIEAVTIIDVLRRAELTVWIGSTAVGPVRGAHDIDIVADTRLADVSAHLLDMIVLPGGMPGAANLSRDATVQGLLRAMHDASKYTCAICAGPMALAAAGLHLGKRVTCFPGFEQHLAGGTWVDERVVVDGTLVTSRGPGTALEFALTLVGLLVGEDKRALLAERMLASLG